MKYEEFEEQTNKEIEAILSLRDTYQDWVVKNMLCAYVYKRLYEGSLLNFTEGDDVKNEKI